MHPNIDDPFWKLLDHLNSVADLQEDLRKKEAMTKIFLYKIISNPKPKKYIVAISVANFFFKNFELTIKFLYFNPICLYDEKMSILKQFFFNS